MPYDAPENSTWFETPALQLRTAVTIRVSGGTKGGQRGRTCRPDHRGIGRRRWNACPRLAPSGKRVLILERGDWLPREAQNWDAEAVFVENRYVSADKWFDRNGKAFQPQVHYFVGGATKFYGAALYRLRERDFGEIKHHDGISPAWPIDYDVMEPYYTQARTALSGARFTRSRTRPTHRRRRRTPSRPVSHEPRIQRLFDDMTAVGLHPFHSPAGVMIDEARPAFSACIRCATCDGFPCLVHAKADADTWPCGRRWSTTT